MKESEQGLIKLVREMAIKEERQRIVERVEKYFDGLIMIPLPQATKQNIINLINK